MTLIDQTHAPLVQQIESSVHVGQTLSPHQHEITPELVRWYIEAMEDDHPWYTGASPFGGPVAPALIVANPPSSGRAGEWFLPNRYGNLHAKQAWELFQPIMVGETLTCNGLVIDRYRRRDRDFVVAQAWLQNSAGAVVARAAGTQSFLISSEGREVVVDRGKEQRPERRFELREGPVLETLAGPRRVITPEACARVTRGSRNYHSDVEESQKLGFKEIVVLGTYITCFISEMMTHRYGAGWFMGGRMSLTFVNPLWAGEAVQAGGVVREITPEGGVRRAHLDVWTAKDDGTRTIVGTASALMEA